MVVGALGLGLQEGREARQRQVRPGTDGEVVGLGQVAKRGIAAVLQYECLRVNHMIRALINHVPRLHGWCRSCRGAAAVKVHREVHACNN
jgi:hypothetical protein